MIHNNDIPPIPEHDSYTPDQCRAFIENYPKLLTIEGREVDNRKRMDIYAILQSIGTRFDAEVEKEMRYVYAQLRREQREIQNQMDGMARIRQSHERQDRIMHTIGDEQDRMVMDIDDIYFTPMEMSTTASPTGPIENTRRTTMVRCAGCRDYAAQESMVKTIYDNLVCSDCVCAYMEICRCDGYEITREIVDGYCSGCREDMARCQECESYISDDDIYGDDDDIYCRYCYDDRRDDDYDDESESSSSIERIYRGYNNNDPLKHTSSEYGDVIASNRQFSAEIECNYPSVNVLRETAKQLDQDLGIAYDGSLGDNGIEFQTPILGGRKGEDYIRDISKTLVKNDFDVDELCGLHVHLDAKDYLADGADHRKIRVLWLFYLVFEDVILSFLPRSRRRNRFAHPLKGDYHTSEIINAYNLEEIEKLWYRTQNKRTVESMKKQKYHNSRYAGINFHSLLANGHLEVRFHSGTLNARKILEWTNLHTMIMDLVFTKTKEVQSSLEDAAALLTIEEKTEAFFALLPLAETSKAYFMERQTKFMDRQNTTSLEHEMPCAA